MQGLELARRYYKDFGEPMLREQFTHLLDKLAVGLCGSGSECLGFDDELSQDHDFEPGFCLFLPGEDTVDRKEAFALERAYAKLPKEYCGYKRNSMGPVGGPRHGVLRTAEFMTEKTGCADGKMSINGWLSVPSYSLLEAVNGEIFFDGLGELTAIRNELSFYPEDIRKKKLAGHLLLMAQSGQYNYKRTIAHGETGAAQFAVFEFARSAMEVVFLLNSRYLPFYKWSLKAMRRLPKLSILAETVEYLLTTGNEDVMVEDKYFMIEDAASQIIEELQNQKLTKAVCGDLEKHAYSVNDAIEDGEIRNRHILCGI